MDPFCPNLSEEAIMVASSHQKKRSGRKKFRETRHPVYRGVRQRDSGKWVCEVREPQKQMRIWLGTFPTAKMAARAHDMATLTLRGRLACLNFADSAWKLTVSDSKDTKDIQRAASKAARDFGEDDDDVEETETAPFFYMDEEEILGMPRLLANMAQGMLLPPPTYTAIDFSPELNCDLSLWTFSV